MKKTTMPEIETIANELEIAAEKSARILLDFDRLPENPDRDKLKAKLFEQLGQDGFATLVIFTCLDWLPEELKGAQPELFIGDRVRDQDLFIPRVRKLSQIQETLRMNGVMSKLTVVIGDTDVDEYFGIILRKSGIFLDEDLLKQRAGRYISSFIKRTESSLMAGTETVIWSEVESLFDSSSQVPTILINKEAESMKQSYLFGKNFEVLKLSSDENIYIEAAKRKVEMYGRQGIMTAQALGGILLQTETPWLLKTELLKSSGADFAAIYPWVRKEEIDST